jgi:hypothetical protein
MANTGSNRGSNSNRGLASADEQTRSEVASKGGKAYHEKRGQSGSDNKSQRGNNKNSNR